LSLDVMDISGEQHLDISQNIYKRKVDEDGNEVGDIEKHVLHGKEGGKKEEVTGKDPQGAKTDPKYCGDCYGAGAAGACCNTCNEVREAYRTKGWSFNDPDGIEQCKREGFSQDLKRMGTEGCRMFGYFEVSKVAGNFHFAPGKSFQQAHMHVHDLMNFDVHAFNVSHTINSLSFGEPYPGMVNPLDKKVQTVGIHNEEVDTPSSGMFQYFVKIVPTNYDYLNGTLLKTNQFSVTNHFRKLDQSAGRGLPGVFIFYDLSPIMCTVKETRRSFARFLTSICAIIGGIFTVSGILDKVVYCGQQAIAKKMQLGKAS